MMTGPRCQQSAMTPSEAEKLRGFPIAGTGPSVPAWLPQFSTFVTGAICSVGAVSPSQNGTLLSCSEKRVPERARVNRLSGRASYSPRHLDVNTR